MIGQWWILTGSKLRETWNHRLRFGRSGVWFILFEVTAPMMIIFWLSAAFPKQGPGLEVPGILGFLVSMNLLAGFGNSYNRAEGALFSDKARVDRLLARPRDVVQSAVIFTYLDNLRPTMQAPLLLALILAYYWFPGQVFLLWGLVFALPLFCAAAAVPAVILVKRFMSGISGLLFISAALLVLSGMAGAGWFAVNLTKGVLLDAAWFNLPVFQPANWWFLFFILTGFILIVTAKGLAHFWEEALLLQEEQSVVHFKKDQAGWLMVFLSALRLPPTVQAVMLKEWLSLRRSSITKFRLITWFILSVVPFLHPGLRLWAASLPSLLILVFVVWVFCFGEVIASAYQSEADRLGILWLAAVKPGHLALGKFLAYLPLVLFALGTAGITLFVTGLRGAPVLPALYFILIGTASGIVIGLTPAAMAMNKVFYHSGSVSDMALEQAPVAFPSMLSFIALIGFLAAYCYIIVLIQSSGMASLASVAGVFAGCGLLAVLAIAVTGFLLKRCYSL